jgi:hypothetical protein
MLLNGHGLVVEKSAVFGMASTNPRLLKYAVYWLQRHPIVAVRCYNWIFFPLGLLFQQRLKFSESLMELKNVHEVLLVCRNQKSVPTQSEGRGKGSRSDRVSPLIADPGAH